MQEATDENSEVPEVPEGFQGILDPTHEAVTEALYGGEKNVATEAQQDEVAMTNPYVGSKSIFPSRDNDRYAREDALNQAVELYKGQALTGPDTILAAAEKFYAFLVPPVE